MVTKRQIRAARDLLKREGWCQKVPCDASGARCILGAFWHVAGDDDSDFRDLLVGLDCVNGPSAFVGLSSGVAAWNDDPARTYEQVDQLLAYAEQVAEEG